MKCQLSLTLIITPESLNPKPEGSENVLMSNIYFCVCVCVKGDSFMHLRVGVWC